jgi:predicted nucleic acid-binding protein
LYTKESDSSEWEREAISSDEKRVSSSLLEVELAFAFRMKEQRGELVRGGAKKLMVLFRKDVAAGRFQLFPMGADVLALAAQLADELLPNVSVRTLDAIHLATAELLKCSQMASADERMIAAARHLGIKPVTI